MTEDEAIAKFKEIAEDHKHDPEAIYGRAHEVLIAMVPPRVAEAYEAITGGGIWYG